MQLHQKLSKKGVVLIGLSYEDAADVGPHIRKDKTPYIIGAESQKSNNDYGIQGYPTAVVIDPKGTIVFIGHPADPKFEQAVNDTVKKTPPTPGVAFAAASAERQLKDAEKLLKSKKHGKALDAFEALAADYADTPAGKKAAARLAELKNDAKFMAAVRDANAEKECKAQLAMARSLAKNGNVAKARQYYERLIKTFPDTSFAETAKQEMDALPDA